ncbi:MAG: alpha-ketoacid dehydrogenase subunit beta [Spirochaetota bacterium]|nr:MAG: alpha-ketoacid dehydrogenase subunit beta [Spirochaetota bacterium]
MKEITYLEAINQALFEEMERDESVFVFGEDVAVGYGGGGVFGVTKGLFEKFGPDRVIDTPLSEVAITGAAVGAALVGLRPVAEIMFADFLGIIMDQLVNNAAKMRWSLNGEWDVPIVYRMAYGAGVGAGFNHSQSLEAMVAHIPGLKVVLPSDPADAKGLLKAAIRDNDPVIFMEHKLLYKRSKGPVPEGDYTVPLGKGVVKRPGKDVTIIATGAMVRLALEAGESLHERGISAEVIDPRSIQPLDEEIILSSVKKTGRAIIVHEAPVFGGTGGEIAALLADKGIDFLDGPVKRVGSLFTPIPNWIEMEQYYLPSVEKILSAVEEVIRY